MMASALRAKAFSLVEVALSLGIASFCLVAIFGLLPVGLRSNQTSIQQTAGSAILSEVAADLRATPPTISPGAAATSQQFAISIPANPIAKAKTTTMYFTGDGQFATALTAQSRYCLTITFLKSVAGSSGAAAATPNPTPRNTAVTLAVLQVSWPAAVPVSTADSVQTVVALDRN